MQPVSCGYLEAIKQFLQKLKFADIISVYKKDDSTKVKSYRLISVLPTVPKTDAKTNN